MTTPEEVEKTRAPLIYHLEEFRSRLWKCCTTLILASGVCYYFSDYIYAFLAQPLADAYPDPGSHKLIYTGLAEAFSTYVHMSLFAGFLLSFPMIAYQFYMFLAPGMYKDERGVLKPFLIIGPVLFFAGAALAYYFIIPMAWKFLLGFETHGGKGLLPIESELRVSEYFSLVMHIIIAIGLVFQLPVILTMLASVGLLDSGKLARGRKYAVLAIVIVAAFLTPPDAYSQIGLSIPLYLLYEISILACRRIEKRRKKNNA